MLRMKIKEGEVKGKERRNTILDKETMETYDMW